MRYSKIDERKKVLHYMKEHYNRVVSLMQRFTILDVKVKEDNEKNDANMKVLEDAFNL